VSITARDRKVLLILLPVVLLAAFWFLILSPKRAEVAKADKAVTEQQVKLDEANVRLTQLKAVEGSFQTQYASVVRLGKAIPSSLGMPSLLVQLDSAAKGTGIKFDSISAGERTTAAPATPAPAAPAGKAAAGGETATTGVGKAAETAGNAVNTQNQSNEKSGGLDTKTSTATGTGGIPVGGGATNAPAADGSSGVPGLDSVTLDLAFSGTYFALADFLHRMKRFVKVNNDNIKVSGRLITIDGLDLKLTGFGGKLTAAMRTTVYLVPKAEGVTAGATPEGPGATQAAAGQSTSTEAPASSGSPKPPEAVVTP
jgi:hypothetical protein